MIETEENEKQKLITYVKKNKLFIRSSRAHLVDQRYYTIAVLHYKFGMTEQELALLFNRDHSTINYGKVKPYSYFKMNDPIFKMHCKQLIKKFPYDFPEPKGWVIPSSRRIYHNLTKEREQKLLKFKALYPGTIKNLTHAINHMIDKFL
jgi:hypothetical protein